MLNTIQFPVKGTYYYAADLALESGWLDCNAQLTLIAEPDNPYDKNAIQIWCDHPDENHSSKLLIGYVPRALAKQLNPYVLIDLKHSYPLHTQVIHRAKLGKQIEIECQVQLHLSWISAIKVQWLCFWTRLKNRFKND
ncbi:MAG: HIRAN domain-containing protein [Thiomicrorhabdus sp.]|nr:HIRAN domain-containing protein [Thiomicrorhabdus sp.]